MKLPPQNINAEQSALGAALISVKAADTVLSLLDDGDFYALPHRRVYTCLAHLVQQDVRPDTLSVLAELQRRGWAEGVGGLEYLNTLAESVPATAHADHYCDIVRRKAVLRRLIEAGETIINHAYAEEDDLEQLVAKAEALLYQASAGRRSVGFRRGMEIVQQVVYELLEPPDGQFVSTGFPHLDFRLGGGFEPTMLYLLAGRSGMGKTALMAACVKAAAESGVPVGVFSLEMAASRLVRRHLAMQARMPIASLKLAQTSTTGQDRLGQAAGEFGDLPVHFFDEREVPLSVIRSHARKLRRKEGIGLFVLDYLQLVSPERGKKDDVRHFTMVAEGLKSLARELEVPVLALSQLTREVERSENKRPQLYHLRESAGLEMTADGVMLLYNPNYYKRMNGQEVPGPDDVEVIVAKNRDGAAGTVELVFDPEIMLFSEPLLVGEPPPPITPHEQSHWSFEDE